jgi:hypothetical protein
MVPELIVKTRGFILSQFFDWTHEGHSYKPSSVDQRLACRGGGGGGRQYF